MKTCLRYGVIIAALFASAGFAAAQNSPMSPSQTAPTSPSPRAGANQMNSTQLTAQQKTQIFQTVTKEKVKSPPPANLQVSIGSQVPASVELYPLPANVVSAVPATKQYKYTVAQNQVVLVDPATMRIVDVIKQ